MLCSPAGAQSFGQNQVKNRSFEWSVRRTEHFDLHFDEDSEPLVPFAAGVLERSYRRIAAVLDAGWDGPRKPFFLYASLADMQRSRIVDVSDGTGGVTEAFKNRFIVFNDGSKAWLDTVTTHELAHVFQFHILIDGFWRSARILKTIVYPLWMMEGMAEYLSWGLDDTAGTVILRDAAVSNGLIPLYKLEHFSHLKPHQVRLAYESGGALLGFLDREYGPGSVRNLIRLFESRFESSAVLTELTGLDIFKLDAKWREYEKDRWNKVVWDQNLFEPEIYGKALTFTRGDIPEQNSSPVLSQDGSALFYLTTRYGHPPSLIERDLSSGKEKKLVAHDTAVESLHLGNFSNLSRVLTVSPDGGTVAFAGSKNHRDSIYLYDRARGRLERLPVPGFQAVNQPAFSPDGRLIAFSGLQGSRTDIFIYEIASKSVRRLTDDPQDDQTPFFTPDGLSLVYSSEIEVEGDSMPYQRRLYAASLAGGAPERILDLRGAARDPVVSADGRRILFCLEGDGAYEAYEFDRDAGRARRLTRSIGAAYTPTYAPNGDVVFSAFRKGSVHLYRAPRDSFPETAAAPAAAAAAPVEIPAVPPLSAISRATSPFSTDLFLPAFFYSSNGGLFWTSYWQGSDMLGNHQASSLLSYASGAGLLDYQSQYVYNRWRTTLQAGAAGRLRNDAFDGATGLTADESSHAQFLGASYPFDRFHRLDLGLSSVSGHLFFETINERVRRESRSGTAALVRDTVRGRYLVANAGNRLRVGAAASPRILGGNFVREAYFAEGVQYVPTGSMSSFVLRGYGLNQQGSDATQFILGGIGGVRGFGRSTAVNLGRTGGIATAEWRFPVFPKLDYYMWYFFPDFYFKAITAAVFTDAGHVWDTQGQFSGTRWNDVRHSYGAGLRVHTFILQLFPLVVHFDYARRTNAEGDGVFYVYLGPLF